jgi:hypothetical protein
MTDQPSNNPQPPKNTPEEKPVENDTLHTSTDQASTDPQPPMNTSEENTVRNVPVFTSNLSSPAATSSGHKCPTCGYANRTGVLVCENCGTNLISGDSSVLGTRKFHGQDDEAKEGSPGLSTAEVQALKSAGTEVFDESMVLRLEIDGAPTPILIYPKAETALGRRDPATGTMPDVDLTSFAGYRMGVSRHHAVIRLNNKRLEVYDLGSSNGTLVNGVRLAPHQPYPLRDGDEITLGKMVLRAIFQGGGQKT